MPLRDEVARARAGLLLSAAAAWHPLWLKWRASLREVFQASKRFGFALSQGNHSHTPARPDPEGGGAAPEEGHTSMPWRKNQATGTAVAPVE